MTDEPGVDVQEFDRPRGLSAMGPLSRRTYTLLAGVLVLGALIGLAFFAIPPIRYVALVPGETCDTLGSCNGVPVIKITGKSVPSEPSEGELRLVTVGAIDHPNVWNILVGWLRSDTAVVPRETVYAPGVTTQEATKQDLDDMRQSQDDATVAALRQLNYPVTLTVTQVTAGGPSAGVLQVGDVITMVNGKPVAQLPNLPNPFAVLPVGSSATITYTRGGTTNTADVTLGRGSDGSALVGLTTQAEAVSPYQITLAVNQVGGPSAGMMMALGIIDRIGGTDLTGGKVIAGTGEIDDNGNVGIIGGIQQKMVGAHNDGATYFLSPAGNCAEALAAAVPGLTLVKVTTLASAVQALTDIRSNKPAPPCTK